MLDQSTITIEKFLGLLARGQRQDNNAIQKAHDYFEKLTNLYHQGESLVTRPGYSQAGYVSDSSWLSIKGFWPLRNGYYLLIVNNGTNDILVSSQAPTTSLGTVPAGAAGFRIINLAGRVYIIWLDSNIQPLSGSNLSVYRNILTPFANAAGAAPIGTAIGAANGAAGKVEAGLHIIAVAYETNTGHITIPGPLSAIGVYIPTQYTAPGALKINLTNISVGPSNIIARHILASKIVRTPFNGDVTVPELFFVPGGKIANNTATTLTVDFYDTELLKSADYLLDLLATISSSFGLTIYGNRLVSYGEFNTSVGDYSTVRFSDPGLWESFNATDGFKEVFPGNGLVGVMNAFEQDGNLYLLKGDRCYVTRDNGQEPINWPLEQIDVLGTHQDGIAKIDDTDLFLYKQSAVIQNERGIYRFRGGFDEKALTFGIEDLYRTEVASRTLNGNPRYGGSTIIDSERKLLFSIVTDDYYDDVNNLVKGPSTIFVGNFEEGLFPETIKWSTFRVPRDSDSLSVVRQLVAVPSFRKDDSLYLTMDNKKIHVITHTVGKDGAETQTVPGSNLDVVFEIITGPIVSDELDFMQSVVARFNGFCQNEISPVEVDVSIVDLAGGKDSFGKYKKESLPFRVVFDGTEVPKIYDATVNLKAQLPALRIIFAAGGNNLMSNVCYFHKFILFGKQAAMDKVRGKV